MLGSAHVLGITARDFWRMTPAEFVAIRNAHTAQVRLEWGGFAAFAAAFFEGHRDKAKGGLPIDPDVFLPQNPDPEAQARKRRGLELLAEHSRAMAENPKPPEWATSGVHADGCKCLRCRKAKR